MNVARTLTLAALVAAAVSISHADTITSTPSGGFWSSPGAWQGGVVPAEYDDVIIIGPVQINGAFACQSLTVETAGSVTAAPSPPPLKIQVSGAVLNGGTIDDGTVWMDMDIGGDIHNAGFWNTHTTTLTGVGDRQLSDISAGGLVTDLEVAAGAGGDVTVTTPVSLSGFVDLRGLRVILQPGSHLTLNAASFSGEILAAGNEIRFLSWSYLQFCTLDDAVIVGDAHVASATFTTRVTVMNSMMNTTHTGGGAATIEGDLINHGVIQNDQYSFWFRVHGDIENHGSLAVPNVEMIGDGATHRLFMGPEATLYANVFMPEFQPSTLIAETPVTFGGGLGLGVGTLILEPGADLHFPTHSGLGSGTVEANGNTITTSTGNSGLSELTIDDGVIGEYAAVFGDVQFRSGLTVAGHLSGWPWAEADVTVAGRLRNEGIISDGDHAVRVTVLHDLENLGAMTNQRVTVAGAVDQFVAVGPGIAVPEFVLESGLAAAGYQWYRDGVLLAGEIGPSLILSGVGAADYGRYHCEGDGLASRDVFIAEVLDTTDVPGLANAALEQNHPNPFNPATNIAFSLDRSGPVSLVVYDLAGREVDRLVSEVRGAGRHVVAWQPRGLSSGTYVYRLRADGADVSRKCSLLK